MLRRLLRDRVNVYRKVETKDPETRAIVKSYPAITHEAVACSVQIGGRVGARQAVVAMRTGEIVNSPARVYYRFRQRDANGTVVEIRMGDKVEVTVRDRQALSAAEKARETFIALEDAPSPIRRRLVRVSLGTEQGTDR